MQMFDRIQILFERLVGVQGSVSVPLSAFRPPHRLPAFSARPACWRRAKRVGGNGCPAASTALGGSSSRRVA